MLHVTNGDCAAERIGSASIAGERLCWCDVLHEGPIPAGISWPELTHVRAAYLAAAGYDSAEGALQRLQSRDEVLAGARTYTEIVLWFEHDLYDQLQLMQALHWFYSNGLGWSKLTLVQADDYLGQRSSAEMTALFQSRTLVTRRQLHEAERAWNAIRSPDPRSLAPLLAGVPEHPHLAAALLRLCREYPSVAKGCSLTEHQILRLAQEGVTDWREAFARYSRTEEAIFLGDLSFLRIRRGLMQGPCPLLTSEGELTPKGQAAVTGTGDRVVDNGIDRWIGGVHLRGSDSPWRWDDSALQFIPSAAGTR